MNTGMIAIAAALALCSVSVSLARHQDITAAVSLVHTAQETPAEEVYLIRDYNGELCVFRDGELLERTGIPVATLPKSDRELVQVGIYVTGEAALSQLLGDLGS